MKILYTIVAACLLLTFTFHASQAQWAVSYQDPNAQFVDAAFPTDDIGYFAATDTGGACVLRTTDGGISWNKRYIPGWSFVNKIAMLDSSVGYLMKGGAPVQILKTTDGFQTYTTHNLDSSFVVEALSLLSDSTGLYLNNGGRLRRFKQNGAAFNYLVDTLFFGQNLQMVTPMGGYLDTNTGLLKTTDGGLSWIVANNNLGFSAYHFRFSDPLKGYFSDGSHIYKTTNGGGSFVQQLTFPNVYSFATKGNLHCVAANDTGNVMVTADGGTTWQPESTGIAWIAPEPYKALVTPGGYCYLFCNFCGEIRKRQDVITAIAPARDSNGMVIYPNPFTTSCKLTLEAEVDAATISIVDLLGQEVRHFEFSGQELTLAREGLPAGVYMVQAHKAGDILARLKIVVQ